MTSTRSTGPEQQNVSMSRRASTPNPTAATLSEAQRAHLDVEGWIALPVFTPAEVARFLEICTQLLAEDRSVGEALGGTAHVVGLETRARELSPLWDHPIIRSAVTGLLPGATSDGSQLRCALPGHGAQSLHPDAAGFPVSGEWTVCTVITALCDFTESNGATRVVPRSHREQDRRFQAHSPRVRHPRERILTGPVGTVFVFNGHLLHSGTENRTDHARPAVLTTFRRR